MCPHTAVTPMERPNQVGLILVDEVKIQNTDMMMGETETGNFLFVSCLFFIVCLIVFVCLLCVFFVFFVLFVCLPVIP